MTIKVDERNAGLPEGGRQPITDRGIARRELLTRLSATGVAVGSIALPASWSRPVVDSVVLPAHAQTTFGAGFFGSELLQVTDREADPVSSPRRILDLLATEAQAQVPSGALFRENSSELFLEAFLSGDSRLILAYTVVGTQSYADYLEELSPPPECESLVDDLVGFTETRNQFICFSGQIDAETPRELTVTGGCFSEVSESVDRPQAVIVSSSADAVEIRIENGPQEGAFFMTLVPGGTAPDCSCVDIEQLIEDAENCSINSTSTTALPTFDGHA